MEQSVTEYVEELVGVFREVRRVLKSSGTLWLNLGDSYAANRTYQVSQTKHQAHDFGRSNAMVVPAGLKPKDLIGLPWRAAFALQADGWWLRSDIIWSKPNPMPESVADRPTKAHEYVFLLTKSPTYYFDADAVREAYRPDSVERVARGRSDKHKWADGGPGNQTLARDISKACSSPLGRNVRTVWEIATQPYAEAHFATFPPELAERCVKAGTSERGCCPACGAPWERVVEREALTDRPHSRPLGSRGNQASLRASPGGAQQGGRSCVVTTLGWRPSCSCDAGEPVPCTVLDPFSGAATTLLVADRLQRRSIGIELNSAYVAMAARRLRNDAPLFAEAVA